MKKRDLFDGDFDSGYGVPINENIRTLAEVDPDAFHILILILLNVHRGKEPYRPAGLATKHPWQQGEWHIPLTKLAKKSGWPCNTAYEQTRRAVDRLVTRWDLIETRLIYTVANTGANAEAHVTRATAFRVKNFHSLIKLQEGAPEKRPKQKPKQTPKRHRSITEAQPDNTIGVKGKTGKTGSNEKGKRVSEGAGARETPSLSPERKVTLEQLLVHHYRGKLPRGADDMAKIHSALAAYPEDMLSEIGRLHTLWNRSFNWSNQGGRFIPTIQGFLTEERYRKPPRDKDLHQGGAWISGFPPPEKKRSNVVIPDDLPGAPAPLTVQPMPPARAVSKKEPY